MKKRILGLLLTLVMLLGMIPATAMTANAASSPAFTTQPVGGEPLPGESITVTWATNFTPLKLILRKTLIHPIDGLVNSNTTLSSTATSYQLSAVSSGYYTLLAYYSSTQYIASNQIYVPKYSAGTPVIFTAGSTFEVGMTATVDIEAMAEKDDKLLEAYFNDEVRYQWRANGSVIASATTASYTFTGSDADKNIQAVVIYGSYMSVSDSKTVADAADPEIRDMIDNMSLRDKVTQMMMVDFRKWGATAASATDFTVMNDQVRKVIEDYNFGSIILFSNNIKTTDGTFALLQEMQAAATKDGGIALLISADQEGGNVYRLGSGTALPGNMALGATYAKNGTTYAYESGKIIGSELSVLGINTNLAPVVDVNNNPNNPVIGLRSYSDDATVVGQLASAQITGMAQYNVVGCAKHFPGHGDTATDSHYGLPCVDKPLSELQKVELKPYEVVIDQGVEMIMTAHILYPQLENDKLFSIQSGEFESLPATMSDDILTGLLKEDMGFKGIIVTDAMNMAGISEKWDPVQAIVVAIHAGVDMVCMPCRLYCQDDLANLDAIIDGVMDAVQVGEIPMSRINDAVERILTVKKNRGILDYDANDYTLEKAQAVVGCDENREMEREIAAAAITVVKNENNVLPLQLNANSRVLLLYPYSNEGGQMLMAWNRAKEAGIIPDGAQVDYFRFNSATVSDELQQKLDWADTYIIISEINNTARMEYKHWLSEMPNKLCEYAAGKGKTSVIASCDKPYDVQMYPDADAILAAYGCKGSSVDPTEALTGGITGSEAAYGPNIIAAVEVALGTFAASGKLPLNIPKYDLETNHYCDEIVYERGYGLEYASFIQDVTVNCIGDIDYTLSVNVVTVDHEIACKVGYLSGDTYVAIAPTKNSNGTYRYTVPTGVTDVILGAQDVTTLLKHMGVWYYINDGEVDFSYTGLVKYNGAWYYVKSGKLASSTTTLVKYNNEWWYVVNGKVASPTTALVKYNGEWWYVVNGKIAAKTTTLVKYNGEWFYVINGKMAGQTTTLVKYNNEWWYIVKGKVASNTTTLVKYNNEWWYIVKGKVASNTTTLVQYNGGWYYLVKGKLAAKTTTLVKYNGKWYYVKEGKVDFGYTGKFLFNGTYYNIKNGVKV